MAQLYVDSPSIAPGDTLWLRVSSNEDRFRVDFYRQGVQLDLAGSASYVDGQAAALQAHDTDFQWPAFAFAVPLSWRSGVYVAIVAEGDAPADVNDNGSSATTIFVVLSADPGSTACILYKVPTFTYTAYNELADPPGSLYTGTQLKVTMRRPGCGAGAVPWDAVYPDEYDQASARQTFAHWDQKFIQWLESNKYAVEYCTDLDVHRNQDQFLSRYRLVLSVGHDEYWSEELRDNLDLFVSLGGNLAFFSGNVCWWRVHVTDADTALICDKSIHAGVAGYFDQWWTGQNNRPENSTTGVSYRNAGGHWAGPRPDAVGYQVQYATHWVFKNVVGAGGGPLQEGDVIGDGADALVGYECDGAALAAPGPLGRRTVAGTDGTPSSFLVLGYAPVASFQDPEGGPRSMATMGLYSRAGTVFTAATTDWARVLLSGNSQVDCITRNVLDKLQGRSIRITGLQNACSRHPVVEGATIQLSVDTTQLSTTSSHTFFWITSAGVHGVTDESTFSLTLPSPPEDVHVTVTVHDGSFCPTFGTLSFRPMSHRDYEQAQIICRLRDLITSMYRFKRPLEGAPEASRLFVDPLWDPIRGYVGPSLSAAQALHVARASHAIEHLAIGLSKR